MTNKAIVLVPPLHVFILKTIICVRSKPYTVQDLVNFVAVFNDINEQGMSVGLSELQEVKNEDVANHATFFLPATKNPLSKAQQALSPEVLKTA